MRQRKQKKSRQDSEKFPEILRDNKEKKSNKERAGDETEKWDEMKADRRCFHLLFSQLRLHLYSCPPIRRLYERWTQSQRLTSEDVAGAP